MITISRYLILTRGRFVDVVLQIAEELLEADHNG